METSERHDDGKLSKSFCTGRLEVLLHANAKYIANTDDQSKRTYSKWCTKFPLGLLQSFSTPANERQDSHMQMNRTRSSDHWKTSTTRTRQSLTYKYKLNYRCQGQLRAASHLRQSTKIACICRKNSNLGLSSTDVKSRRWRKRGTDASATI